MYQLGSKVNLVICQKSKVGDWIEHLTLYYEFDFKMIYDCTKWKKNDWEAFAENPNEPCIMVINYDLAWRRKELLKLNNFSLILDESSLIQNETAKRSKFILKLKPDNVILLSGTPTGGKYEKLWSQMNLLGWNIPKKMFYDHYIDYYWDDSEGFPRMVITGYKNEERLKKKMRDHGCHFLKTDEVFDLPDQIHQTIKVDVTNEYKKFRKNLVVEFKYNDENIELIGDNSLTERLYKRQLCGQYNQGKLEAFSNLLESTDDRVIVFYNFYEELDLLTHACGLLEREISIVNGKVKDLYAYENISNSVTFIQYQAGAMGLNLQKANKIIYFTPTEWSELFEQSKKRVHRIGQDKPCFYYYLTCKNSIEEAIYETLAMRKDYTDALYQQQRGI